MPSIKTLVPDIYKLMEKDQPLTDAQCESLGRRLTTMLKQRLASPKGARPALSMSSVGAKCLRQLWYKHNMPEKAEALPPQTKIKFLYGDILEELLLTLADASGHEVTGEQETLEAHGIKGHRDAVIDGVTVDVKTANSRGFVKFKQHRLEYDDPFGYLDQLSLYIESAKDDDKVRVKSEGAFLAIDKELGDVVLDVYPKRSRDYAARIGYLKATLARSEPPARAFVPVADGKSGNEVIPMECRYCAFKEECYKDANQGIGLRKFIFSTGPKWFTKILREPNPKEKSF